MPSLNNCRKLASLSLSTSTASLAFVLATGLSAEAIQINFDYSFDNGFFDDQARRDLLELAADSFEPFTDSLEAIVPSGQNTWSAVFTNPSSGMQESIDNLIVPADTLIIYVGARNLGGSTLGTGGPGGFTASGFAPWFETLRTRGQGDTQGPNATDFGPWGGVVSFDSDANWNFDPDMPVSGQNDFLSVALHEISHVFGIGTSDSWDACITGSNFTCDFSTTSFGGNVPLDADPAHWAQGTTSTVNRVGEPPGFSQETALDPNITVGTRKLLTELDYAGLGDVGWEVAIPEPLTILGAGTAAGFGAFFKRVVNRKSKKK